MLEIKSGPELVSEVLEQTHEKDNYNYDFTSPVTSFLKESKRQVERYFRGDSYNSEIVEVKTRSSQPSKTGN